MRSTPTTPREVLAQIEVSDELHASIEHDTHGNPVIVIIAPLKLTDQQD